MLEQVLRESHPEFRVQAAGGEELSVSEAPRAPGMKYTHYAPRARREAIPTAPFPQHRFHTYLHMSACFPPPPQHRFRHKSAFSGTTLKRAHEFHDETQLTF